MEKFESSMKGLKAGANLKLGCEVRQDHTPNSEPASPAYATFNRDSVFQNDSSLGQVDNNNKSIRHEAHC